MAGGGRRCRGRRLRPAPGFAFVYDDIRVVLNNSLLHSPAHWPEILAAPWQPHGLYRPFTSLTCVALGESIGRLARLQPSRPVLTPFRERPASMTCLAR